MTIAPCIWIRNKLTGAREIFPTYLFKDFNASGEWEVCEPTAPKPIETAVIRAHPQECVAIDDGVAAPAAAPVIQNEKVVIEPPARKKPGPKAKQKQ